MAFPATNLSAYYKLDEAAGTTRKDSVGANNLSDHGTVGSSAGKIANAADFVSASNQYLTCPDASAFQMGTGDFSIAAWGKFTSTANFMKLLMYGDTIGAGLGYGFRATGGGGVIASIGDGLATASAGGINAWNDGNWHLFIATFDRTGNVSLYVDNNLEQSVNITLRSLSVNNTNGFAIGGGYDGSNIWDGSGDEAGIWKGYLLTGADRTALWNGGAGITYSADVIVNLAGVSASPDVGSGAIDVAALLSGVEARAAIGTGTVQIQIRIHHATDGGRPIPRRSRTVIQGQGVESAANVGRPRFRIGLIVASSGSIASAGIGGLAISMDSGVSVPARRIYLIGSQVNVTFDGQPMPSASLTIGTGSITTTVDFYPEEIAALLQ